MDDDEKQAIRECLNEIISVLWVPGIHNRAAVERLFENVNFRLDNL